MAGARKPGGIPRRPGPVPQPAGGGLAQRAQQQAQHLRAQNLQRQINQAARQAPHPGARPASAPPRPAVRPAAPPARVMPPNRPPVDRRALPTPAAAPQTPRSQPPRPGTSAAKIMAAAAASAALNRIDSSQATPQLTNDLNTLQNALAQLQESSTLADIGNDLDRVQKDLTHALDLLESARQRGYYYQKDLDTLALAALDRWQTTGEPAYSVIEKQAGLFQTRLMPLNTQITQLNAALRNPTAAANMLRLVQTQANSLQREVDRVRTDVRSQYSDVATPTYQLNSRLASIHWALKQLDEASFKLDAGEELVSAVQARWDQAGDEDPEGVVYLTTRRLVFEQKQKIAKKKLLFVTVSSELVQKVVLDLPLTKIQEAKPSKRGLFSHQDFVEISAAGGPEPTIPLHLDGHKAEDWSALLISIQNGKIADDRTSGTLVGYQDLLGELTQADILTLQQEVNDLQDELQLKDLKEALASLDQSVTGLPGALAGVRARGYVIESDLEQDAAALTEQWGRIQANAAVAMQQQEAYLAQQMGHVRVKLAQLLGQSNQPAAARPLYLEVKSAIASAEAQANASEDTVLAQFEAFQAEVEGLKAHLEWVDWMLQALATASFQLLATESGVAAVEATLLADGVEPQNGILFLTDQRLLWEDRVDTYELKADLPLTLVERTEKGRSPEEDGDDLLLFSLVPPAPWHKVTFDLAAPVAEVWLVMIGRARSGDYVKDRAVELDQDELDRIKAAPTHCPTCSAAFTAPVLRGQREIRCEYCSSVVRL